MKCEFGVSVRGGHWRTSRNVNEGIPRWLSICYKKTENTINMFKRLKLISAYATWEITSLEAWCVCR
jgi:hypothetical protein